MSRLPLVYLTFGKVSDPSKAIANEGEAVAGTEAGLGLQVALVGTGTPAFRLNSPGWMKAAPELIGALKDRARLRLLCRDRLEAITPAFSAAARRWIGSYLDLAERQALGCASASDNLNDPGDLFFEALLPLPSANLRIAGEGMREEDAAVRFDLAFWDGHRISGVIFGDANASTPSEGLGLKKLADRLGDRLKIHRLSSREEGHRLAADLVAASSARPAPWYGPYRAEEFRMALP